MKYLPHFCMLFTLLAGRSAHADCPLAFAPPEVRRAASEHYYRSPKRDAPAPGHLPASARANEVACMPQADGDAPAASQCVEIARDASQPEAAHESSGG